MIWFFGIVPFCVLHEQIRKCCSGAAICQKCWRFMIIAVKVLDAALRGIINNLCKIMSFIVYRISVQFLSVIIAIVNLFIRCYRGLSTCFYTIIHFFICCVVRGLWVPAHPVGVQWSSRCALLGVRLWCQGSVSNCTHCISRVPSGEFDHCWLLEFCTKCILVCFFSV